jgi:Fe-S cluster biosynthesis and repair protein YggX
MEREVTVTMPRDAWMAVLAAIDSVQMKQARAREELDQTLTDHLAWSKVKIEGYVAP